MELNVFHPDPKGYTVIGFKDLVDPDGQPVDHRTVMRAGADFQVFTEDMRPCTLRNRNDLVGMRYLGRTTQPVSDALMPEGYTRLDFDGGAWLERLQDPENGAIVECQCVFINMAKFGPETVARLRTIAKA